MNLTTTHHRAWCEPARCVTGLEHKIWSPPPGRSPHEYADVTVHTSSPTHFSATHGSILEAVLIQAEGDQPQVILIGADPEDDVILAAAEIVSVAAWLISLSEKATANARGA